MRVERGAERTRQIAVADRRAHALQVHGASLLSQCTRMLAIHFVGSASATAQREDVREARSCGRKFWSHLVGAEQVFERARALA